MNHPLRAAALAGMALLSAAARAETSPYYIGGSLSVSHYSNVLGLADGQEIPAGLPYESKGDTVQSLALVGGLDQTIGRERLTGSLTWSKNKFRHNSLLDNDSYAVNLGLDWSTIGSIGGNIALRSNRDLVNYSTTERPTGEANLVTSNGADFNVHWGGTSYFSVVAGANLRTVSYSLDDYATREFRSVGGSLGLRYNVSPFTQFGLTGRRSQGKYPHLVIGGETYAYDRTDIDFSVVHELTDKIGLNAHAAWSNLDYKLSDDADFKGVTGSVRATWQPLSKVGLSFEWARDRGQELRFLLDNYASQYESGGLVSIFRLRGVYSVTPVISLDLNGSFSRQTVSVVGPFISADSHEENTQWGLGLTWAPTRTVSTGCNLSRQRTSNQIAANLNTHGSTASCYVQLTLQP